MARNSDSCYNKLFSVAWIVQGLKGSFWVFEFYDGDKSAKQGFAFQ